MKKPELMQLRFDGLEVAIVENEASSLRGLTMVLTQLGCRVVWMAKDEEEAKQAAQRHMPAVAFVDLRLHRGSDDYEPGWQLIQHLLQQGAGRPFSVIIFSSTPMTDEIVLEAIRLGCSYIVKEDLWDHETAMLAGALLAAQSGSVFLSNEIASGLEMLMGQIERPSLLSETELVVLKLVAEGLSNKEIAKRQFVAVSTIKTHISNILAKLEVDNRTKAAEWYRQQEGR